MINRKLASVQQIASISPIPGADKIEMATVLGWSVVVQKGQFQTGDLCIYFEVDSIVPKEDLFAPLADSGYRVKTRKFLGQISQGFVVPFHAVAETCINYSVGTDVTDELGVEKWEPKCSMVCGEALGPFPSFIPKTDEPRLQSNPELLDLVHGTCQAWEKLDGTSFTAYVKGTHFGVCSRNLELKDSPESVYWQAARALHLESLMRAEGRDFAIQGELCGPGIQGNKYKFDSLKLFVFDAYNIEPPWYFFPHEISLMCDNLHLPQVPLAAKFHVKRCSMEFLVSLSDGSSMANPETPVAKRIPREGIVVRTELEPSSRLSFKVLNPNFLLKYDL